MFLLFVLAILISHRYLVAVLICIPLNKDDAEHLFMCLSVTCIFFSEVSRSSGQFLTSLHLIILTCGSS